MKEQQNLEWKEAWRDEYLRWICGFANAEGGTLVIGRNDQGQAVGLANAARLLEEIPNKVRDVLGIMVAVNLLLEDGKELLEIRVDPYPSPVSYKGEYHYRSGSTKQELKGAALSRFLLRKQGLHWDGVPIPRLALGDCNPAALQWFRDRAAKSGRVDEQVLADGDAALLASLQLDDGEHLKRPLPCCLARSRNGLCLGHSSSWAFSSPTMTCATRTKFTAICFPRWKRRWRPCAPSTSRPTSATRACNGWKLICSRCPPCARPCSMR
jgi:hypothetical protein